MRKDLRPWWLKKLYLRFRHWYTEYFLRPECAYLGPYHTVMKPWYVRISGNNISIGRCFTAIGEPMSRVEIGVWGREYGGGRIDIGDCVLLSPGTRISASDEITIGDGTMFANGVYVTDCDWHSLYDRTRRDDRVTPVHIGRNVWLGDNAMVLKGVTIGDNAVVAARAVVTRDVPADSVVAGNPARVVKNLDAQRGFVTRMDYFADPEALEHYMDRLNERELAGNTFWRWLWSLLYPPSRVR